MTKPKGTPKINPVSRLSQPKMATADNGFVFSDDISRWQHARQKRAYNAFMERGGRQI